MSDQITQAKDSMAIQQTRWSAPHIADLVCTLQYNLTDVPAGDVANVVVLFDKGQVISEAGTVDNPTVTLTLSSANYVKLVNGQLNLVTAYLRKEIKLEGHGRIARSLLIAAKAQAKEKTRIGA